VILGHRGKFLERELLERRKSDDDDNGNPKGRRAKAGRGVPYQKSSSGQG
jgi:hypothetical protein